MTQLQTDLKALYKLLRAKSRWTKGDDARNKTGLHVTALSKHATCWCLLGGMTKVANNNWPRNFSMRDAIRDQIRSGDDIQTYNDNPRRTHPQILKLIKNATL